MEKETPGNQSDPIELIAQVLTWQEHFMSGLHGPVFDPLGREGFVSRVWRNGKLVTNWWPVLPGQTEAEARRNALFLHNKWLNNE